MLVVEVFNGVIRSKAQGEFGSQKDAARTCKGSNGR